MFVHHSYQLRNNMPGWPQFYSGKGFAPKPPKQYYAPTSTNPDAPPVTYADGGDKHVRFAAKSHVQCFSKYEAPKMACTPSRKVQKPFGNEIPLRSILKSRNHSGAAGYGGDADWTRQGNEEQQLTQMCFPITQAYGEAEESETFGTAGAPPQNYNFSYK